MEQVYMAGKGILAGICLFGALVAANAGQTEPREFELPSFEVEASKLEVTLPVAVKAAVPRLRANLAGTEITMTFSVASDGTTYAITHNARAFDDREAQLAAAMGLLLRSWRFEPAKDKNGKAIAIRMELPVKAILSGESRKTQYARLQLDHPKIRAVAKL